ncbi:type I DNA topoisomerase [Dermatophilaceae bacterium Sec6.4]
MSRKLVIVESPTKVKSIGSYLGDGYVVDASIGHIRDLPTPSEMPADMKKGPYGKFAVDVDNGFDAYYVVDPDKRKKVAELKRLLKDSDELILATDDDREGEAIAWHLLEVLKPKVPVSRMVFGEITKEAILRAAQNTRELNIAKVDAQETRRILDRLYGYEVSPVLWRKIRQGLSAGRVQSVATRIVVERERERMAFRTASYWDIEGDFTPQSSGQTFAARLSSVDGRRVASGRDFADTGELRSSNVVQLDKERATSIANAVAAATATVTVVQEKPYTRRPSAPFITSTLQQEASRKLRLSSKNAMRVAQRLYENGYITYMRTDSTTLSQSALNAARSQATEMYGAEYVTPTPRVYDKKAKNAQEAHEAIRPAGDSFRTPAQVAGELRGEDFALYELIWKRTVASQMTDARGSTATVRLSVPVASSGVAEQVEFSASGTIITFRGFLAAYEEGRDAGDAAEASEQERRLPQVAEGALLDIERAEADGHETSPPARYTEASLIRAMEERGIGRPSTYAATVGTIQDRGYVRTKGTALVPTWLAFAVTRLLEEHFPSLVDYDFTASMEEGLDSIASGDLGRVEWLQKFYFGQQGGTVEGLREMVEHLGEIDARGISTIEIGEGMVVRVGRYGPYVEQVVPSGVDPATGEVSGEAPDPDAKPRRATIGDDIAPDEMTPAKARELLEAADDDGRVLGQDPESGHDIIARAGRYGPYVTEVLPEPPEPEKGAKKKVAKAKPKTASLFTDMELSTIDLETALRLMSLPRVVGTVTDGEGEEATEVEITAQNGRYGPYLKKGTDSRTLASEQQLFDITLTEAIAIYAEPKRRGRAAAAPLKELGEDPVSGKPVVVKDGRFGPYVTDGESNATLRKDDDPATITPERGFELLAEKRAKGPTTRKRVVKKAAKKATKSTAKKATAKKATATKTTVQKAAGRKAATAKS